MEDTAKVSQENSETVLPEGSKEEEIPTSTLPEPTKKSKREDRSKKDEKNLEQFMKTLNSVSTPEEKLAFVSKKYIQCADDNKKMQFYIKQSDKRYALIVKEKEQLQHEYNKTVLVKSKLENLCRELQKQNKAVKEESLLKIREEEERRKETQAKFQNTLSEITTLLQQNNEKNSKLRDDNINMSEKFKSVVQQYQLREQQVEKMAKQMSLESQLSEAKLQKAALEHQAEKERLLADLETLKVSLVQSRAKNIELQGTETALKGQLAVYTDKYDEFQNALVKSNQVFGGFKEQIEKMSKKIQKLEKESLTWKKRWETSQTALLEMCSERQISEERAGLAGRHLQQMQSLCRTLQAERSVLLNVLKEHDIERPPVPAQPPSPAPAPTPVHTPASNAKVDAMAANCVQLRQSLAHLQSQLNVLTSKQEESLKPEKQKKSKSKKNKMEKAQKSSPELTDVKGTEPETSIKEQEKQAVNAIEHQHKSEEKLDSQTMESLMQVINFANINLSDLGDNDKVEESEKTEQIDHIKKDDVLVKPTDNVPTELLRDDSKLECELPKNNEIEVVGLIDDETAQPVSQEKFETVTCEGNKITDTTTTDCIVISKVDIVEDKTELDTDNISNKTDNKDIVEVTNNDLNINFDAEKIVENELESSKA